MRDTSSPTRWFILCSVMESAMTQVVPRQFFFLFFSFLFEHLTKVQIISTFSDNILQIYFAKKKNLFVSIFQIVNIMNSEIKICYLSFLSKVIFFT